MFPTDDQWENRCVYLEPKEPETLTGCYSYYYQLPATGAQGSGDGCPGDPPPPPLGLIPNACKPTHPSFHPVACVYNLQNP